MGGVIYDKDFNMTQQPDKLDKIYDKVHEIAVTLGVYGQRVTVLEEKVITLQKDTAEKIVDIQKKVDASTKFSWLLRIGGTVAFIVTSAALTFLLWILEFTMEMVSRLNSN
jgi:hypothetical protein